MTTPASSRKSYRGRFAPSPTGPLHFGSLATAVGSYLAAKAAGGEWHIRIDDLDRARTVPGAADDILRTLAALGFEWNGAVWYQSDRDAAYAAALDELERQGAIYACSCSRRELQRLTQDKQQNPDLEELRYPGLCRSGPLAPERGTALRFRVPEVPIHFEDALQGRIETDVTHEAGDFVVRRRDGIFAYQLACAVDDQAQGFTHIVRGADLLGSTARQILLQNALGYRQLAYAHLPLMVDAAGQKFSKSAGAAAVDLKQGSGVLWRVLQCLQQKPPADLQRAPTQELWAWARAHWMMDGLRGRRTVEPFAE